MKTIKGWIPTGILTATLLFTSISANAGIITAGFSSGDGTTSTDPCKVDQSVDTKTDYTGIITAGFTGIITAGFTGIITAGYTGIIVTDLSSKEPVNCGIIVTDSK